MDNNLDFTGYSGECEVILTFTTDPYYYHSDANNNFSFFCDYNAPVGNVNLVFPDTLCAAFASFEGYSGELSFVTELLTADLYQFWEGSTADVSLATYRLLGSINAYSGEYGTADILTSALLVPIAHSGEYSVVSTITLPVRAELSSDSYTGESVDSTLSVTIGLDLYHYTGNNSDASLNLTQYADYIKTEGPSAYWKMDEQSGTSAIDYTGNNTAAVYTNGPVLANASPVASKYAVYFDGINDMVVGPPNVNSNDLTQELWVKPDAGATITLYTASNSGTNGTIGQRYAVYPYHNGSGSNGGISVGSNGIQVVAHGSSYLPVLLSYQQPVSTTSFTHILVSWSNRTPTLYVNGVAVATGYQARAPFQSQGLPSAGTYGYYKGYMQDVAIYPSALTADQAREHYLAGLGLHFIPRFEPVPAYTGQYVDPIEFTIDPHPIFGYIDYNADKTLSLVLLTSSIIDAPAYAGENNLVTFTTFPSAGLGIFQANSGERNDLILSTFSLLYADARGGEAGVADLYVNPFDQIDSDARSGERSDFDLYTVSAIEAIAATGDSSIASLDVHPSIPLTVPAYAGEYVDQILLVTSSVFVFPAYAGELNSVTFTTFAGEQITLPFYAGSRGDLLLSTVNLLSAQAYTDQYSDATLTVFYASALVPVAYSDQYGVATLRTQDALNPLAYSDQNAYATLTVALAIPMSATAYAGNSGTLDLQLGITFPSIAYEGARLFFDIEYVVNLGMPLPAYAGENALVADMATTYNLPSIGYAGETGLVNLGVEYAVEIIGYSGARGYADLTLNPPDLIAGVAYSGQYLSSLSLSTRTLLPNIGYSGEGTVVTLTDSPAAPLLLMNYGGQAVIASMQTATQLPIGRHYSGEWANVIGMTNEPHWYMVTGTHCVATLATSVAIPITMYEGQRGSLTYDTHPSEPLGMFYFRPGEWMTPGLEVLYSANFRVLYRTSIMTQVDIRSATYFDLTTDECCGERPQSNNLMFIIEKGMYPEEVGYGNRTYMTVDLRCNPRMKVEFPTGHVAELIDNVDYFEITFSQISHQIELDWFADLRHKLCKGYFIPTGNWVVVELNDILPEDCYVDRFYGGETFSCALSDDIVLLVPDNGTGAFFSASLETKPPWLLKAYSGEKLTFDFPWEAKHTYYSGERLSIGFYEAPINVYAGASAEFEIHTEYGIRFLEEGCFDNEFVYQNDDGDTIPELFNPVPVEGEPFAHSVRAECF